MVLDFGLLASGLFDSSSVSGEGMGAKEDTVIWNDVGIGIVPIGSIIAWHKSMTGVPSLLPSFVECDGSVISDGDSPMNGETLPNLNANARVLRGSTTSGTNSTLSHGHSGATGSTSNASAAGGNGPHTHVINNDTSINSLTVVWVMRIK